MGPNSQMNRMHTGQKELGLTADHTINEISKSDLEEAGSYCTSQFSLRLSRHRCQPIWPLPKVFSSTKLERKESLKLQIWGNVFSKIQVSCQYIRPFILESLSNQTTVICTVMWTLRSKISLWEGQALFPLDRSCIITWLSILALSVNVRTLIVNLDFIFVFV